MTLLSRQAFRFSIKLSYRLLDALANAGSNAAAAKPISSTVGRKINHAERVLNILTYVYQSLGWLNEEPIFSITEVTSWLDAVSYNELYAPLHIADGWGLKTIV